MQREATPGADLGLGALLITICAATLWESRGIAPGTFEPLGSAPVPQAVAWLIIVLSLIVMARAWRRLAVAPQPTTGPAARWADAIVIAALTVVYCLMLHSRLGRFDVLTAIYLFLAIGLLVRFARGALLRIAAVAVFVGFGCQLVFTRVFVVDLPGAF